MRPPLADATRAEAALQAQVQAAAAAPGGDALLLSWLDERAAIHQGRGTASVQRLRGAVLLALARRGPLGEHALLATLEELDTGRAAYPVAAAAQALRLAAAPSAAHAVLLAGALRRLRDMNDYVDLDAWGGEPGCADGIPTARQVVLLALQAQGDQGTAAGPAMRAWLADEGHTLTPEEATLARSMLATLLHMDPAACCDAEGPLRALARRWRLRHGTVDTSGIRFEDQDGRTFGFTEAFEGQPGIVVFFYTRCDNPDKCSLSIAQLAQVQRRLAELGQADAVRLTAISYDPGFDDPARLRAYGAARGFEPRPGHRLVRATAGWDVLRQYFEAGVGYLEGVVNRHRIEAHVHDAQGQPVVTHLRLRWQPEDLLHEALALVGHEAAPRPGAAAPRAVTRAAPAAGPLLLLWLALFPKCPICGVAYLSLAGMAALPTLPGPYLWLPVLLLLLLAQLGLLAWLARKQRRWAALLWSAAGSALAVVGGLGFEVDAAIWIGLALTLASSLYTLLRGARTPGSMTAP